MNQFDESLFKENQSNRINQCKNNRYRHCKRITRLLIASKYYSTLNITENDNDAEIFRKFMNDIYYELLNDYIHFNNHHTHELEDINNDLITNNECKISTCIFTSRHHNTKKNGENNLDDIMNFYKQTMDSLHFYLFHCYDVGIRTKKQNKNEQEEEEENKDDQYFDAAFSRVNKIISESEHITKQFDRFSTKKNTKFTIKTEADEEMQNDNDGTTYLDVVYEYLQSKNVKKSDIKQLYEFIQDEEYDTDTVGYDIHLMNGNVIKTIDSDECIQKIKHFIQTAKASLTSLSVGLRFYYWDYYKKRKQLDMDEQVVNNGSDTEIINNYNNHSGYSICDLFVVPRYISLLTYFFFMFMTNFSVIKSCMILYILFYVYNT